MENRERKKYTRKQQTIKIRHDRLVSRYIQFKYPEAYAEAEAYYTHLETKYPNKRDLCKTLDFIRLTTGAATYTEYYHRKRQGNKPKNKGETAKKQHTIMDNMVLEIPLIDSDMAKEELSLNIPQYEELMQEIRDDPDLYCIFNNFTTPGDEILDMSGAENLEVTVQHTRESFPGVPDQTYEDLVREITEDPELKSIFDDIEITEDPELKDIFDDIEQTPLEMELSELGW